MSPRRRIYVDELDDELTDATGVAEILGLKWRNSVSEYQRTYADMPRPVVDLGNGRPKLWLRSDIEKWQANRQATSKPSRGQK
jgi:glutathione-regulated potassium-efflux system ancillary protein KefG